MERRSRKYFASNQRFSEWDECEGPSGGKRFAPGESSLPPLLPRGSNFFHATFVPGPGIFPLTRPHLTVLGAVGLRCDFDGWTGVPSTNEAPARSFAPLKNGCAQDDSQPGTGGRLDLSIRRMFK